MTLRQLTYFREIARQQSYTAASRSLYVAQSALSVSMKKLETELGCTLFVSNGRSITLTDAGERFLGYTEEFLKEYEAFKQESYSISEKIFGELRIGVPFLMDKIVLSDLLAGFCQEYPNMQILIANDGARNIQYRVSNQEFNAGFATRPAGDDLSWFECFKTDLVVVMRGDHPLAKEEKIAVEMLKDQKLMTLGPEHEMFFTLRDIFSKAGVNRKPDIMASNTDFVIDLVKQNIGITVQARVIAESLHKEDDGLVLKDLDCPNTISVGLLYPKRELYQSELLFVDYVSNYFSK